MSTSKLEIGLKRWMRNNPFGVIDYSKRESKNRYADKRSPVKTSPAKWSPEKTKKPEI